MRSKIESLERFCENQRYCKRKTEIKWYWTSRIFENLWQIWLWYYTKNVSNKEPIFKFVRYRKWTGCGPGLNRKWFNWITYGSEAGVNAFFISDLSNPEMSCAISLAEAMHIPVITPSPIDEFQQRSYLISVAYRMGFRLLWSRFLILLRKNV